MSGVHTRRLVLSVARTTPDGGGGERRDWVERGALWATVRMRSGALRFGEFGRRPALTVRITTHALPEDHEMRPVPGDRLRDGRRIFEVEAVHEQDRRTMTILGAEVPAAEGER